MNYNVKIDEFEGPLDLLLHLIKQSNIEIVDISIEDITNQYVDYIHSQEELNISVDSSYLVMAAELMEIKSKSLLPKKETLNEEEETEEVSKEMLIDRLVEYKKYKELTPTLKDLEEKRQDIFIKSPENINYYVDNEDITYDKYSSVDNLLDAFKSFLERQKLNKPLSTKVTMKEYSVRERTCEIKKILIEKKKINFVELFDVLEKDYIIVTFLSVLEMAKDKVLVIVQENNFSDITLQLKENYE